MLQPEWSFNPTSRDVEGGLSKEREDQSHADVAQAWSTTIQDSCILLHWQSSRRTLNPLEPICKPGGRQRHAYNSEMALYRSRKEDCKQSGLLSSVNQTIRSTKRSIGNGANRMPRLNRERTTCNNPAWSFHPTCQEADGRLGVEREDQAVEM